MTGSPPVVRDIRVERPTLVHFWATWCAPCIEELPRLHGSRAMLREAGIDLLLVSIDTAAPSQVPGFLRKIGLADVDVVWDSRSDLYKKFASPLLPTTIFLNGTGKEIGRVTGAADWSAARDAAFLRRLLSGAS
jgi:thiol-disulfide isomerase/thioredoxin